MKLCNLISIALFLILIGETFCNANLLVDSNDSTILELTVISASFDSEMLPDAITSTTAWKIWLYGLDSAGPIKLPIDSNKLRNTTNVVYQTQYSTPSSSPVWNEQFSFSAKLFDDQSNIALELWALIRSEWQTMYNSGTELTVSQLKSLPQHQFSLNLFDENGKNTAQLNLEWQ